MGIRVFEKNKIDLDFESVIMSVIDATALDDGANTLNFLRNRNNFSGFGTTGSDDAANTQIDVDMGDTIAIDRILLVNHNFKAYTIQYFDGFSFVDFSTPISETVNTETDTYHEFDSVDAQLIRLIITGTLIADDDKLISQFIITKSTGEFVNQLNVSEITFDKSRESIQTLSKKFRVVTNIGSYGTRLRKNNVVSSNDLDLQETIFDSIEGLLIWINSDDTAQFAPTGVRSGYRAKDIFLMLPMNEYSPAYANGRWCEGVAIDIRLVEVI